MPHEVETMFYNLERGVPWHGLGTPVREALTSEEAFIAAGLDWSVEKEPLFLADGTQAKEHFAIVRTTDRSVLGVVGPDYTPFQNREAFAFVDALLGEGCRYDTAGSLRGGKIVWVLARLPEDVEILGDKTEQYLCFSTAHDGSRAVTAVVTPVRVVCANTLSLALGRAQRKWSVRHTTGMSARVDEARRQLDLVRVYMRSLQEEADRMANTKMTDDEWVKLVEELLPIPEDAGERAVARIIAEREQLYAMMWDPTVKPFEETQWGAVQAVSDFEQHRPPRRHSATWRERRFEKIVLEDSSLTQQVIALLSR